MKTIHLHFSSILMLLLIATHSLAQSTRLDSLQNVEKRLELQGQMLQVEYDSLYRIIAQCKTDEERLVQYAVKDKINKKAHKIAKQIEKVQNEILLENARIEQEQREARLAKKQAAVLAASPVPLKGELHGYEWVDMGLPSGTKWATCNVGAADIHGVGTRIAWGEVATKKTFSPATYSLNNTEPASFTGDPQYDMATAKWGEGWYTPTKQQWDELIEHCDWDYVIVNGVNGVLFTSYKTYNTIFLPSTGYTDDDTYKLIHTKYNGQYWSSTGASRGGAHCYIDNYEQGYMTTVPTYGARCVRAVCGTNTNTNTSTNTNTVQNTTSTIQSAAKTVNEAADAVKTIRNILNR